MKSSVFRGVHWAPGRRRWMARIQPARVQSARFYQQYHSEMEAVAHYNAVSMLQWPDDKSFKTLLTINSPWKGRPVPPQGWDDQGRRVIDIDREYAAVVDESFYQQYKDNDWFVRETDGHHHAWVISQIEPLDQKPWFRFSYLSMETLVFGGPAVHLNGLTLDNRKRNLAAKNKSELQVPERVSE